MRANFWGQVRTNQLLAKQNRILQGKQRPTLREAYAEGVAKGQARKQAKAARKAAKRAKKEQRS